MLFRFSVLHASFLSDPINFLQRIVLIDFEFDNFAIKKPGDVKEWRNELPVDITWYTKFGRCNEKLFAKIIHFYRKLTKHCCEYDLLPLFYILLLITLKICVLNANTN